jgi:hypothetical protein
MVCSRGLSAASRSGSDTTSTSALQRLPFPFANPDDCSVSASAQLSDFGSPIVSLLAS